MVFALANQERLSRRIPLLEASRILGELAQSYAATMASQNKLSHDLNGGLASRLAGAGYAWQRAGENIAAGQRTAEEVHAAWMASPGHRANILGSYTESGVGVASSRSATRYWCVVFGYPAGIGAARAFGPIQESRGAVPEEWLPTIERALTLER